MKCPIAGTSGQVQCPKAINTPSSTTPVQVTCPGRLGTRAGDRSIRAVRTRECGAIGSRRKTGRKPYISCNCFFMCALSLRHEGVRMLLTHEEKEISYPVSLVIFTGEGKTTPMTDRSWLSKNCQSQRRTPNYGTALFCRGLDTTPACALVHEMGRFAKQELGQVTSWLIRTYQAGTCTALF